MDISTDLSPEVLDDFYKATSKDIRSFLVRYSLFYTQDYDSIVNFYQGKTKSITNKSFINFYSLRKELNEIFALFTQFENQFYNVKFLDLLEMVEQINDILLTLSNISKWARATTDTFGYNQNIKLQYVMTQFDSLEKIAKNILDSSTPQDDWYQISIDNQLKELDYDSEGGSVLNLTQQSNSIQNFKINAVVDVIYGKSIYGRDINRFMHYDIEQQDIATLNEDDTINQSVLILATLRKNENPDFPDHGLQSSLAVGQSRSLMNFPVINRQMTETFSNDDTLKNFQMIKLYFEQDNLFIDFEVTTRLGEIQKLTMQI